jgi:hypothetical protein
MIEDHNDGRSKSFFCRAAALLDLTSLETSLDEASRRLKTEQVDPGDKKTKAKTLKEILNDTAPVKMQHIQHIWHARVLFTR